MKNITEHVIVRFLDRQEYDPCWQAMQSFTNTRHADTLDEIWLLEHHSVFTQGQNGKPEHILNPGNIPIVRTDRGGQVTYHGPGQLMVYTLIDLKRKKMLVREFVSLLEQSVIDLLNEFQITAHAKKDAPGVYITSKDEPGEAKKICSVGLRIRKGCSYHGIAFNIAMDLEPFTRINPCGFRTLKMTHFAALNGLTNTVESGQKLINYLLKNLRYTDATFL